MMKFIAADGNTVHQGVYASQLKMYASQFIHINMGPMSF